MQLCLWQLTEHFFPFHLFFLTNARSHVIRQSMANDVVTVVNKSISTTAMQNKKESKVAESCLKT